MKKYGCSFVGREVGSIGIFYGNYIIVDAENREDAQLKLYDTYDHITKLNIIDLNA